MSQRRSTEATKIGFETQNKQSEMGTQELRNQSARYSENNNQTQHTRNNIRSQNPRDPSNLYHPSGTFTAKLSEPLITIHTCISCSGPGPKIIDHARYAALTAAYYKSHHTVVSGEGRSCYLYC